MSTTTLENRVGIVTGGARGIGAAITQLLAADGATVIVMGLASDRERTESLRASLNGAAHRVAFREGNVAHYDICKGVVDEVRAHYGHIDFLVNNAGITADHTVRKMTVEEWQAVLAVNLSGPFFMIKAVLDHMLERDYGRIVNISSVVGHTGNFGQANYASAKAGVMGLTKTVALEVAARGITVNAVAPGFINTDMVAAMPKAAIDAAIQKSPERRLGQPDEVARVVRFLLDESSGYITGAVYDVNGGLYM
ncbi:MAG TPA: 3-oxoacyl-ACP reductase FabG [Candidatus Eremiobacteraceae bacterium]|nr:3-oxoacyl-ACP reductase FabG [Candidatus Eremiobacteraceae bacterium]